MSATTCIHCGAMLNRPGAKFCTKCGKPQDHSGALPQTVVDLSKVAAAAQPAVGMPAPIPSGARSAPGAPANPLTLPDQSSLVIQDEGQVREVPLGNQPLVLGRAPTNDIVLTSRFVSAKHARIEPDGAAHRIVDIGSTNGILSEGKRLAANTPLKLADGDVLRIGDPATGNFVTLTYRNPLVSRAAQAGTVAQSYPLDPNDPQITIGREGSEIVLENPQVSRQHAVIDRMGGRHVLRDVGSTNGTFVNGQRITEHTLTPGDVIQIGAFKLVYDGDSLDQYDQRGALRIDARNLSRTVRRDGKTRMILKDVSLSIEPREFVALVGGSGTGKSTLMNALSGYAQATGGHVLVNGDDYYRNFDAYRTVLGYVPQDDIIHRTLPVDRALGYAAELRLPADTAPAEITQRIARVLEDVEMTPHRDKLVENLSGGQRKRVSIGAELLADPSLFFLDEPTSGLDPGLEKKMMYTLRRLADSGRTVVLVTHATANISQCDHVAFMSDGRLVYFGPPAEALQFFNVTSGDFADIYTKLEGVASQQDADRWSVVQRDLQPEYDTWLAQNQASRTKNHADAAGSRSSVLGSGAPTLAELWEMKFRASPQYARYVAGRLALAPSGPVAGGAGGSGSSSTPRVSPLRQFGILARRYLDLIVQDQRNLLILLLQAPIIGMLLMLVAKSDAIVGEKVFASEAKKVLFMLATVAVWFGIINAAREITKESAIFRRERLANLRIGPYVLSKIVILTLLVAIQSALLLGLVGLKVQFPAMGVLLPGWIELYITTLLTSLAGLAIGLAISSAATTPDRAISIVPLALIPQILFAGVIFSLGDGYTVERLLSWFTVSRWAMDAYGTTVNLNEMNFQPGLLRVVKDEYTFTAGHLLSRWAILLVYMAVCLGITAWQLRSRDRQV